MDYGLGLGFCVQMGFLFQKKAKRFNAISVRVMFWTTKFLVKNIDIFCLFVLQFGSSIHFIPHLKELSCEFRLEEAGMLLSVQPIIQWEDRDPFLM